jgi:hypothetical protein
MGADAGGHCDSVSALVAALAQCGSLDPCLWETQTPIVIPDEPPPPDPYRYCEIDPSEVFRYT